MEGCHGNEKVQIISKLREAEELVAKGISVFHESKQIGIVEQTLRDEVLKREIFYTLE